jgi:choice-of-anchor A domain-containing protein/uncharacterized repeat protein (TIGR01451 family)
MKSKPFGYGLNVLSAFLFFIVLFNISVYSQVTVPFSVRYAANEKGDIQIVGNTLMTCPAGGCSGNNNDYAMRYVDIDGDASTNNSSSADFTLPASSSVLWAGLYWNGVSTASARNTCLIKVPGASSYTSLTGITYDNSYGYQGFKDVTSLVSSAGSGTYTVANVLSTTGSNEWAGWALVIVYRDPSKPQRNLTVFDGLALVSTTDPNVNITISGFSTPLYGPVNVALGVVAYDGDQSFTGDAFRFNGTTLTNSLNPADNFFNSSITRFGTAITAKNPNYSNQLGLDIDVVDATGTLANGATSAVINLTTGGESYNPGVVTTCIDLYAPDLDIAKSFVDINGGDVNPGDTLLYTIVAKNDGQDGATNVVLTDSIQANQTYVPGSIVITDGANMGSKTDAASDDQADFANGILTLRLGTGASSSAGGSLVPAASTTVKFKVVVNDPLANGQLVNNYAIANYNSQTSPGKSYVSQSPLVSIPVVASADLSLTKTVSNSTPDVGGNVVYTVVVTNNGPATASGVTVSDQLPSGLSYVSSSATAGSYSNTTGIWTVGTIKNGLTAKLDITAKVTTTGSISNTAEVKTSDQSDPNSTPGNNVSTENDQATVTIQPVAAADIKIQKTVSPANPVVGDSVFYTVTATNLGPGSATNVVVTDKMPSGITYSANVPSAGSYDAGTGKWSIPSIAVNASSTLRLVGIRNTSNNVTNIAQLTSLDQTDPNASNNCDSVSLANQVADLKIKKTVSPNPPQYGANATFTITVTNSGPSAATGVNASDALPAGLTYVSSTASKGTYNSANGQWEIGSLAANDSCKLTVVTTVNASGSIKNIAAITASHEIDPTPGDRADTVLFTVSSANLSVTKTVSNSSPADGATFTYTVKVHNAGPTASTGSIIADKLPNGLVYVSSSTSQGVYDPVAGTWNVGVLASNGNATLTVTAKVVLDSISTSVVDLGPAKPFNIFILNDLNQPSCDTQGKVAVARDATLSGYSVGDQLPTSGGTEDVLIVGRDLNYAVGGVFGGNVVYGRNSNLPVSCVSIVDGTVRKDSVINFPAAISYLNNLSTSLASYPVNGTSTFQWGEVNMTGSNPFLNVFRISGNQISHCNSVVINVPNGSCVLVNIDSTNINWMGGLVVNGTAMSNVLYNFYEADTITMHGIDVTGSLLAPFATLNYPAGVVHGQVIVKNMYGSGQFNLAPFAGNLPIDMNIVNVAEVVSANEFDPNSTPGNGITTEDDYAAASIHVTNLSESRKAIGNWNYLSDLTSAPLILSINTDSDNNLVASTVAGKIFRSSDNGATWSQINQSLDNVRTIWSTLSTSDKMYAATEQGLYISTDKGVKWVISTLNGKDVRSIVSDASGKLYAGTWGGGVFVSADAGVTWNALGAGMTNLNVTSVIMASDQSIYAGTFGGGIFKLTSGTDSWNKVSGTDSKIWTMHLTAANELYAASYGQGVFVSTDNGSTWSQPVASAGTKYVTSILSDKDGNVFMSSFTGGVYAKAAASTKWNSIGLSGLGVSSMYVNKTDGSLVIGTSNGYMYKNTSALTAVRDGKTALPTKFELMQNYPNPFNPSTNIQFNVPRMSHVTLAVYDILGRVVVNLVNDVKQPGSYTVSFNASHLASGMYFYRLEAGDYTSVKKMILIK